MQKIIAAHALLHDRQIFNVRNRGVHDALQFVLGAISRSINAHQPVFMASTDVKGAFPSVPMWLLRYILRGKGASEQVVRFYTMADSSGKFCMRIGGGYSEFRARAIIGLGQGEKGSPEKYCIVIDPLLRYLANFKEFGLDIGPLRQLHIPSEAIPIVIDDRLVAVLFCDDMFLV